MTSLMHETTVWNGRFAKTTCSQCFVQIRSKGIKTMYCMLWLRAICKSCNISFSSTFTMFTFLGTIADCGAKLLKNTCYCIKLRLVWSRLQRFLANGNPARSVQQVSMQTQKMATPVSAAKEFISGPRVVQAQFVLNLAWMILTWLGLIGHRLVPGRQ
jgi:hypothetical protein